MTNLQELLAKPIERMEFPTHFAPRETQDPLRAIDEWLSGWGDRLDGKGCWEYFQSYSPFYKHRKLHEPEPFFYGGFPLSAVFEQRYKQHRGFETYVPLPQHEGKTLNLFNGGLS